MKSLFVTTPSSEVDNHVAAWDSFNEPSTRIIFVSSGVPDDEAILRTAVEAKPEVIFYIGACAGFGLPSVATFRALREIAPSINLCSDAQDPPWHPVLDYYKRQECFDLQVAIDGAQNDHVDLSTVTAVPPLLYEGTGPARDIPLGFSGGFNRADRRGQIIGMLKLRALLTVRNRSLGGSYAEHVAFLRRCQAVLNIAYTGSGQFLHVKGRVMETAWAGAALFETKDSPTQFFFPPACFIAYDHPDEIAPLLTDKALVTERATRLAAHVRAHYTPAKIYGEILERVGLTQSKSAA